MSDMMIDTEHTDEGDALLFLAGEADLSHVDAVWNAAIGALDTARQRLVLDVSAVTFLDSAILGVLIRIHRAAEERHKAFTLRSPSPVVQRLLRLTGLEALLPVER